MFIDGMRGWAGRPATEGAPNIPSWAWGMVVRLLRTSSSVVRDIPAAQGATDDELVRVVRRPTMDGAERIRHQTLMLLYSSTGRGRRG